ncbi:MAG: hypothetical protein JWL81_3341, partial [Verrucomicrobiales bacterium]|nr:hypothetical protein [Verrucomicrobiales bacterium]
PASPERDAAISGLVRIWSGDNSYTAESFAWAVSIQDPGQRSGAVARALETWMASDPAAAAGAVRTSSLSGDEKNLILRRAGFAP